MPSSYFYFVSVLARMAAASGRPGKITAKTPPVTSSRPYRFGTIGEPALVAGFVMRGRMGGMFGGYFILFFVALFLWPFLAVLVLRYGRRFSLRTLLIGMTLVALALGITL